MDTINIVIVEDDKEILLSLQNMIKSNEQLCLVKSFQSAEQVIQHIPSLNVDVVLMDIGLPGKSGIQAVAELKQLFPAMQFIMCTVFEDDEKIFASLCVGATGYLLKNISKDELTESIRIVHQGGSMMSAAIARRVVESFQNRKVNSIEVEQLSSRQWEILRHLDEGLRYKEIADKMNLSFETIRTYCRNIYEILQVHSRTDALNKVFPKK